MKKTILIILSIVLIIAVIGGVIYAVLPVIKNMNNGDAAGATPDSVEDQADSDESPYTEQFKIGIVQTGLGSASKDCYGGFMLELDERNLLSENITVEYIVEDNKEKCREKIQALIDGDCDLLYTIGRYASETAAELTSDIPIVFGAVNSPDEVGLVESNEVPGNNVTGVSSFTPCFEQIDLIPTVLPDAKSVAVMYRGTDEDATGQGIVAAWEAEKNIGLKTTQYKIEDKDSLTKALKKIKEEKTDVIYIPVDKFLSENIKTIVDFSYENKIPVICGDEATLAQGCFATSEVNYESIGRKAAGLAEDILFHKKDVSTLSVIYKHDCNSYVNETAREKLGIEIPATALGEVEMWEMPTEPPEANLPETAAPAATKAEEGAAATQAPASSGE